MDQYFAVKILCNLGKIWQKPNKIKLENFCPFYTGNDFSLIQIKKVYRLDPVISEGFDKRISIFCKTRLLANSLIIELAYANNRIFCLNQFYATIYTMKKMDQITSILSNLKKYFFAYFQTDSYLE